MEISNLIVIKNSQYIILAAVIIFSLLSLICIKPSRKITFLFFFYLFAGFFHFTLGFMELTFILAVPTMLFIGAFYLFDLKKEIFSVKNISEESKEDFSNIYFDSESGNNSSKKKIALNYVTPVLFCLGIVFLFIKLNTGFIKSFKIADKITIVTFSNIAKEIFSNYTVLVIIFMVLIFMLTVWSITIINNRRRR
ncbi:MAG: hypothetical protein PHU65_05280 [Actinomycetota bacterium]|jgi:hypothetical protein|nr:hypothetical protein [Actinomycetota bacterium]